MEVKTVSRSKILGMQVYGSDAAFIGSVKDIEFTLGEGKPLLVVETKYHTLIRVDWSKIGAVEDIVLLKEPIKIEAPAVKTEETLVIEKPTEKREEGICPSCGKKATWIQQYKRWYCYNCKKYL
ncbi:MAG: PRC-barrel domain-containing protein [Candidatus Methanomethylicia archaeon]